MRKVFLSHGNKRNNGNLVPSLCAALSAISALSVGRLVSHADSFYCPTVIGFAASLVEVIGFAASLVEEMKEIKEIQVSDVALGRPSASKLQGQELQKVKLM